METYFSCRLHKSNSIVLAKVKFSNSKSIHSSKTPSEKIHSEWGTISLLQMRKKIQDEKNDRLAVIKQVFDTGSKTSVNISLTFVKWTWRLKIKSTHRLQYANFVYKNDQLPFSQKTSSYPEAHVQLYIFTMSLHVAPFWQGSLAHSSVSVVLVVFCILKYIIIINAKIWVCLFVHITLITWHQHEYYIVRIRLINTTNVNGTKIIFEY